MSVIGLAGKARAGKSTVAEILRLDHGFTVISFADTLREMALAIDPVVGVRPHGGDGRRLSEVVVRVGWELAKDGYPEVRRFLQRLGTEGVRTHLGTNAWVDAWAAKVDRHGPSGVVAADVRFVNEAEGVRGFGGEIWQVVRPGDHDTSGAAGHVSEVGIPGELIDRIIVNDGTLANLRATVAELRRAR